MFSSFGEYARGVVDSFRRRTSSSHRLDDNDGSYDFSETNRSYFPPADDFLIVNYDEDDDYVKIDHVISSDSKLDDVDSPHVIISSHSTIDDDNTPHVITSDSTAADDDTPPFFDFGCDPNHEFVPPSSSPLPVASANTNVMFASDAATYGSPLCEWQCQNALRLEAKERMEKQKRKETMLEAEKFKGNFYERRAFNLENYKAHNRVKRKLFLDDQEKFHKEADKHYWEAIVDLIPREVPNIESNENAEQRRNPGMVITQGPKPGKPTDLSRMHQLLVKLKQSPPPHLNQTRI